MIAHTRDRHRLGWLARVLLVVAAAGLAGVLGLARSVGARPARVWDAHPARAPALCVRGRDGATVSDLRHDHGVRLVHARADRSIVASQPGGLPVRRAVGPVDRLVARVCRTGRAGGIPVLSGPLMGLLLAGAVLSLASWLIRWTVSPAALTAAGP